jgi:hypothetical protein
MPVMPYTMPVFDAALTGAAGGNVIGQERSPSGMHIAEARLGRTKRTLAGSRLVRPAG